MGPSCLAVRGPDAMSPQKLLRSNEFTVRRAYAAAFVLAGLKGAPTVTRHVSARRLGLRTDRTGLKVKKQIAGIPLHDQANAETPLLHGLMSDVNLVVASLRWDVQRHALCRQRKRNWYARITTEMLRNDDTHRAWGARRCHGDTAMMGIGGRWKSDPGVRWRSRAVHDASW